MSEDNPYNEMPHDPDSPRERARDLAHVARLKRRKAITDMHQMVTGERGISLSELLGHTEEVRRLDEVADLFTKIAIDESGYYPPVRYAEGE